MPERVQWVECHGMRRRMQLQRLRLENVRCREGGWVGVGQVAGVLLVCAVAVGGVFAGVGRRGLVRSSERRRGR